MKQIKSIPILLKIGFIFNLLCLVAFVFFEWKANDLKGFNAWICALSLFGFNSFFSSMAILKYLSNRRLSLLFLLLGLVYILGASVLIDKHYLQNQDVSGLIACTCFVLAFPFIIALLFFNNAKVVQFCTRSILIISWALSFLPITTVATIPIGIIMAIFIENMPYPWQK